MRTSLIEHCPRLKESSWGKLAWANNAEEVCGDRMKRTGSSIWCWQWVDVEDRDSQAVQRQLQHQLWSGLTAMGFRRMCWKQEIQKKLFFVFAMSNQNQVILYQTKYLYLYMYKSTVSYSQVCLRSLWVYCEPRVWTSVSFNCLSLCRGTSMYSSHSAC